MGQRLKGTVGLLSVLLAALLLVACIAPATPTAPPFATDTIPAPEATNTPTVGLPTVTPSGPTVTVGPAQFVVELAETPEKRGQGLSGRPSLESGSGMLFVFDTEDRFFFWMLEMQIALDFVWITADCVAADLTQDVPPPEPDTDTSDLLRYQPEVPVLYVLEINAGEIAAMGIAEGDSVSFEGSLSGKYGC